MAENEVQTGNYVQIHYTGSFPDGEVFDSSEGKDPLEVLAGQGMLIKGFDAALLGMKVGEEKEVDIKSEDAYGEHRPELIREIKNEELGDDIKPEVGMMLGVKAPTGQVFPATVTEVTEDGIKLDANHPLAGKDLHFKIKIEATRTPTEEDMKKFQPEQGGCCGGSCNNEECGEGGCGGNCNC